ncbi:GxGYxYP domain-containing protein [uncultured Proteiniphilum sp.]|uniref:GxGYxYP domain-containing protein n=1 Tax=uncultured Proteiniphilum sp. TaxID=497637 RepID=UPI002614C5B2|nr:GxGYxYP domain-containing protein [uncultured Proteiniphilum sp.]
MLIVLFSIVSCKKEGAGGIGMFDLKYTLTYDLKDKGQVLSLWDDIHTISTLQGVVNREEPRLFVNYVVESGIEIDSYWWNKYRQPGEWLHGKDTIVYNDIVTLIEAYQNDFDGVVVYDSDIAATSNVASAVAGIENLIAIRYDKSPGSLYDRLVAKGPKLPVKVWLIHEDGTPLFSGQGDIPGTNRKSTGSIKNDPYIWFIENYMKTNRCNGKFGAYYIDQKWRENPQATVVNHHTLTNHDFFVSKRAFFFDLSPWEDEPATDDPEQAVGTDLATLKEFLSEAYRLNKGEKMCHIGGFPAWAFKYTMHAGGSHDDVPTEWEFSRIISAYNAFKDADAIGYGALANASFWQHFPLEEKYAQKWVTQDELKKRGYLTEDGKVDCENREFMIFYVGDYDASSWITQRTPTIWDHPDRGKLPLMWAISPVLDRRAPMVMHNFRKTATPNDYFVAADNGAGYLMPGMLQEPRDISGLPCGLDAWANHCKPFYEKWGLSITGFVIDGHAPGLSQKGLDCYASFSPNGIIPQKVPLTLLHGNMPVLRSDEDIQQEPKEGAHRIAQRVADRPIPFHWFRNILKTPGWYVEVMDELGKINPNIELLDAPTFFELYRIWLQQHPDAASGILNTENQNSISNGTFNSNEE